MTWLQLEPRDIKVQLGHVKKLKELKEDIIMKLHDIVHEIEKNATPFVIEEMYDKFFDENSHIIDTYGFDSQSPFWNEYATIFEETLQKVLKEIEKKVKEVKKIDDSDYCWITQSNLVKGLRHYCHMPIKKEFQEPLDFKNNIFNYFWAVELNKVEYLNKEATFSFRFIENNVDIDDQRGFINTILRAFPKVKYNGTNESENYVTDYVLGAVTLHLVF